MINRFMNFTTLSEKTVVTVPQYQMIISDDIISNDITTAIKAINEPMVSMSTMVNDVRLWFTLPR